jgi:hypothetical protein
MSALTGTRQSVPSITRLFDFMTVFAQGVDNVVRHLGIIFHE